MGGGTSDILFGAVQGSIGKGCQKYDSDYDIRFISKGGCEELLNEGEWIDNVTRVVANVSPIPIPSIDKISFWNYGSFFNLLLESGNQKRFISPTLYYQVFQTLFSPYVYDPYGLIVKIIPIVKTIADLEILQMHFKSVLKHNTDKLEGGEVYDKVYYDAVHAVLSLKWITLCKEVPPYAFDTLFFIEDDKKIQAELMGLRNRINDQLLNDIECGSEYSMKMSREYLLCNDVLKGYLKRYLDEFEGDIDEGKEKNVACYIPIKEQRKGLLHIRDIITGIGKEPRVKGVIPIG